MSTYTEEQLAAAYQLGYRHGAQNQPPLENAQVAEAVGLPHG